MALPVAHGAFVFGATKNRNMLVLLFLVIVSVAPDFDFFFVWVLGLPMQTFHRTFAHSIPFALVFTLLYAWVRPRWLSHLPPSLFFLVLVSHGLLDLLCTADAADHGVMLFWPVSTSRWGWPVLVPLYQQFGDSPFTVQGALRFTGLELLLSPLLWLLGRAVREGHQLICSSLPVSWKVLRGGSSGL
jgi:membrane-bound metal-dependent hydrolase YbcI (DUF457 family)